MTVVFPYGNEWPLWKLLDRAARPQSSVAVGAFHVTGTTQLATFPSTKILAGILVIVGRLVSTNSMFCVHELDNPELGSVAIHVLINSCEPVQVPLLITISLNVTEGVPVQLAPFIAAFATPVLEGTVLVLGQAVNAGGQLMNGGVSHVSQSIVIVNDTVELLLQLSIAVYVTVVVPSWKTSPTS